MKEHLIDRWQKTGLVKNKAIIKAFKEVPRENFVLAESADEAYGDYPLPIGQGQTISQPTTIMIMLEALELEQTDKVLEVGAGSGYSAALIAKIAKKVYSLEIIKDLAMMARENISRLKINNIEIINGDGSLGHPDHAPYDKIVVTAASPKIPLPWVTQLKEGGIIVAPVGDLWGQKMIKGRKMKGEMHYEELGYFTFVPLKGKHGYN
ncbi:MAG: protein-L-isoaspartate(D-aspartate) O-methyltransferase [Candidatus Woesearchaeota archaeon]